MIFSRFRFIFDCLWCCICLQVEEWVGAVMAPLALGGYLSLGPLLAQPCEGLLEGGKAASFAVIAMGQVIPNEMHTAVS